MIRKLQPTIFFTVFHNAIVHLSLLSEVLLLPGNIWIVDSTERNSPRNVVDWDLFPAFFFCKCVQAGLRISGDGCKIVPVGEILGLMVGSLGKHCVFTINSAIVIDEH